MNADSTAAVSMIRAISRISPLPASRSTWRPTRPAMPVRDSPPLRMNTAQTVITAGLLKPDSASWAPTRPLSASITSTSSATTSTRSHSLTNSTSATPRIAKTSPISSVMV